MEVTALCFRLLMLEIIQQVQESDAAFLRITPNRLQHFELDSVSLDCVGFDDSIQLRGIKNNEEFTPVCDINKTTPTGSLCTLDGAYPEESGEYWCETDREKSNSVNITVTAGSVILESPVLPVMEGDDVTLRCRNKTNSTNLRADFFKDGILMKSTSAAEMTINVVSKCDEGFYKCSISDVGTSPESLLAVRVFTACHKETQSSSSDNTSDQSCHIYLVLRTVFTIVMVALLLLLVGLLHCGKLKVT